jgi:Zn finger protein HypA/HybF involved in hydrogenase expression
MRIKGHCPTCGTTVESDEWDDLIACPVCDDWPVSAGAVVTNPSVIMNSN